MEFKLGLKTVPAMTFNHVESVYINLKSHIFKSGDKWTIDGQFGKEPF